MDFIKSLSVMSFKVLWNFILLNYFNLSYLKNKSASVFLLYFEYLGRFIYPFSPKDINLSMEVCNLVGTAYL